MNFTETMENMLKSAKDKKHVSSIPMCMAKPMDGTKVRFWTKFAMQNKDASTIMGNSLVGEYKNGYFVIETDKWSDNEVFSWSKLEK